MNPHSQLINEVTTYKLEDLANFVRYQLHVSCVKVYADIIIRHANGSSCPMGGINSSVCAILGGMACEVTFSCNPRRDSRLVSGEVILHAVRVQDDTKMLLGFDVTVTTATDVLCIFEHCIRPMLYPPPFDITRDERNRYLESESESIGCFIWYKHFSKNGSPLQQSSVTYKSNSHSLSFCDPKIKRQTIIGHMNRIRGNCVLLGDALWACLCELLELQREGVGFRRNMLRRVLSYRAMNDTDTFWQHLLLLFNKVAVDTDT